MSFDGLEIRAVSRSLAQVADRDSDRVDAYFERLEEIELPRGGELPAARVRREEGFSVRLVRGGRTWASARDEIGQDAFLDAVRQVSRTVPQAVFRPPRLDLAPIEERAIDDMLTFSQRIDERVRTRDAGFDLDVRLRRHRRESIVVESRFAADAQRERFYSLEVETGWGARYGTLLADLDGRAADRVAAALVGLFRARREGPVSAREAIILGPEATAVVLHEAVAHALEADTLALTGRPEAVIGLSIGGAAISVVDDPTTAPPNVRRSFDDEGAPSLRRWLVRDGVVDQPLADRAYGERSNALSPGAGRRSGRHDLPGPRSSHLELGVGAASTDDLLADGILVEQVERGRLDPWNGLFQVVFPWGRRVSGGRRGAYVGRSELRATVPELLAAVVGIGSEAEPAGAGWCAKGGQRLPVWATTPLVRLEGVELCPA